MNENLIDIENFFDRQLSSWPEPAERFKTLGSVETKTIDVDGFDVTIQFNPARIRSSAANVDKKSIAERPCFLCDANRPKEQASIDLGDFKILVNPFPILPFHLTIPSTAHRDQLLTEADIETMATLAKAMPRRAIFYNGARCGASAPDHFHFQAVDSDVLPMIKTVEANRRLPFGVTIADDASPSDICQILDSLPKDSDENEPKVNLFCYLSDLKAQPRFVIIPRRRHRPSFYGTDKGQMLVSPASIDLAGIMVAPRMEDFQAFDKQRLSEIYNQLCFTQLEVNTFISTDKAQPLSNDLNRK